ncbi:MAG: LPS export ABC transporter permease LptF [Gammaproteobacteria bacterium]|nr:LPS export ABC transporter permease LptF [Gammaproteobacteria bacterium]
MPVIDRYLIKELALAWLGVSLVLLVISIANQLVRYLSDAVSGDLPASVIMPLLGFAAARYLVLLLPVSLFLAALLVFGRMHRDGEMVSLFACGVGLGRIYRPVLVLAIPVTAGLAGLALYVVPWAEASQGGVLYQARHGSGLGLINAGSFRESRARGMVLYAEGVSSERERLEHVFVQSRQHGRLGVIAARRARQRVDAETGQRFVVLQDGYRYEGVPGQGDYRILRFERYALRLAEPTVAEAPSEREAAPTGRLWGSSAPADRAELQWRLSVPLSGAMLLVLALPLSRTTPRQGHYGKLLAGVLIYIVYFNSLSVARAWLEQGQVPAWLGMWWVHAALALVTGVLVLQQAAPQWLRSRAAGGGGRA